MPRMGEPSEALQVADAMEVPAKDMPRAEYEKRIKDAGTNQGDSSTDVMVMGAINGDPAMFLLGSFAPKSIASYVHFAAWVPQSMTKGSQNAIKVAEATMLKALISNASNEEACKKIREYGMRDTTGLPFGEGGPVHASIQLKQLMVGFTPQLRSAPSFMNTTEKVYGPIFVRPNTRYTDADGAEWVEKIAGSLPEWFYVYDPGLRDIAPRAVHHNGERLLFVSPN